MENIDHLIHAKWMITCEEQNNRVLENHSLAIKNKKIIAILPEREAQLKYHASSIHHYSDHAVLPGFVNSHTHLAMNFFRGLGDDLDLMDWLNHYIWPTETKYISNELVYDASLYAMAEMIRSGSTCFNDMYFFMNETAKAAEQAGIRGCLGMTVIDVPTAWAKTPEEYFARGIEFYEQYKNHEFITPTVAPHSVYTVSYENLMKVNELAQQYQLKINIHLQEDAAEVALSQKKYGKRSLQLLNEIGMVSPNLIAIHMTQLDDGDLEIIKERQPNIVHCAESNMKLANGICPVEKLTQMGINIALGTDGAASNNDLDMIGEMRSAAFLAKIATLDPKSLSAEKTLKLATINGARALNLHTMIGSLEPGKSADFIAIHLNEIETQPLYHPISQIVYSTSRNQVTDVWVAGKQLMKNRQLLTLDEKDLLRKAQLWRQKISS